MCYSSATSLRFIFCSFARSKCFFDSITRRHNRDIWIMYRINRKIPAIMPPSWCVSSGAIRSDPIENTNRARIPKLMRLSQFIAKFLVPSEK